MSRYGCVTASGHASDRSETIQNEGIISNQTRVSDLFLGPSRRAGQGTPPPTRSVG